MAERLRNLEPVEIRRRTTEDLPACRALAAMTGERDGYPPRAPASMERFIAAPGALGAWVAELNGHVVGHVVLRDTTAPEVMALASATLGRPEKSLAVVVRLMVDPAVRRRGVARALLRTARDAALAMDRTPVLDVASQFTAAQALYDDEGWVRAGEVTISMGDLEPLDVIVYVCDSDTRTRP